MGERSAALRVLLAGPESSGTKMLAAILGQLGADVVHHSPNYWSWDGYEPHRAKSFDAVVVLIRSGETTARSMLDSGHAANFHRARVMQASALLAIFSTLHSFANVHIVTYESLVYEPGALILLARNIGLNPDLPHDEVRNANVKYYGGEEVFRDQREISERHALLSDKPPTEDDIRRGHELSAKYGWEDGGEEVFRDQRELTERDITIAKKMIAEYEEYERAQGRRNIAERRRHYVQEIEE